MSDKKNGTNQKAEKNPKSDNLEAEVPENQEAQGVQGEQGEPETEEQAKQSGKKTAKKDGELPRGRYSLFGLKKVEGIVFEATEYKFDAGKLIGTETIGKDVLAILKHKFHRRVYERSNAN